MSKSARRPTFRTLLPWMGSAAVGLTAIGLAAGFHDAANHGLAYLYPPLLLASALAVHGKSLLGQVLARGVWWASAIVGIALAFAWPHGLAGDAGLFTGVGVGLGLLFQGRKAFVPTGRSPIFAPIGARATFHLTLLISACSTLSLAYFSLLYLEANAAAASLVSTEQSGILFGLSMLGMFFLSGFYALRVWAWLGTVATTTFVAALGAFGLLAVPATVGLCLASLGVLVAVVQVPLLVALVRGQRVRELA